MRYVFKNLRAYAIYVLSEILLKNRSRDKILSDLFIKEGLYSERDNAFIFNVVINALRYKDVFDAIISSTLNKSTKQIEREILIAMYVTLSQILCMDRIPLYAAVSETINGFKELLNNNKKISFLNYSLRSITGHKELKELFDKYRQDNLTFKLFYDSLIGEMEPDEIINIYRSSYQRTHLAIRINSMIKSRDEILRILLENGIRCSISKITEDCIILEDDTSIPYLKKILLPNTFTIQSELSQLAVDILSLENTTKVLDLCSGNQIKASHIYERTKGRADITSIDIKPIKNPSFRFIRGDAATIKLTDHYDRIIVDAPCSGLGTLSSNPEIKYRINKAMTKRYSEIQLKILKNASKYLMSGGRLLYVVCTITDSETRKVIKNFVEENPQFEIIRPELDIMELKRYFTTENFLRIVDFKSQSFFYALLQKR